MYFNFCKLQYSVKLLKSMGRDSFKKIFIYLGGSGPYIQECNSYSIVISFSHKNENVFIDV